VRLHARACGGYVLKQLGRSTVRDMRRCFTAVVFVGFLAVAGLGASLVTAEASSGPDRRLLPATTSLHRHKFEPTVVGDSLAQAEKTLSAGSRVTYAGVTKEVVDRSARPETVLTQTTNHWPAVPLTVAVPTSRPCRASQLSLTTPEQGSGFSQHLSAGLVIRNVSAHWCVLLGKIQLVGLNAANAPVTDAASVSVSTSTMDALSPHTPRAPTSRPRTYPINIFSAFIDLTGPECSATPTPPPPGLRVSPVTWRVTIPGTGTLTSPNSGPGHYHFESCDGEIDITGASVQTGETLRNGKGVRLPT